MATRTSLLRLRSQRKDLELIVAIEPSSSATDSQFEFTSWCTQQGCKVIFHETSCGLTAIRANEGILAAQGRWIWLLDAQHPMPAFDLDFIVSTLTGLPANTIPIFVHPDDQGHFLQIPASKLLWIDLFYRGWQFPFENIFFPRALFDTLGLIDPHIVMAPFFRQEFLLRICRYVRFEKIDASDAAARLYQGNFPSVFYYWVDVDRRSILTPNKIHDYAVDDLEQFHRALPTPEKWNAYLNYILPYYCHYRHLLPDGLPERAQSLPPVTRHILCVKSNHYDTTTDVGIRNFDVFAQGERFFKLSYIFSGQMGTNHSVTSDAILILRIADRITLDFAREKIKSGLPVGYALDDDLLNLYKDGGEFAVFHPGDAFYDVMVDTIKYADVVLCGGPHVQNSLQHLNRRTVHFEGSVLPQFLPKTMFRKRTNPFKFGYAGGRYRVEEMKMLWPAIERICKEYGDQVRFDFWGLDASKLPGNLSQVTFEPFSISYFEYLSRLKEAGFAAMLVPLFQQSSHRQGKLPNKVYETSVARAIGIYSNVPTYHVVKANRLGLIVEESADDWYNAMRSVLEMPEKEYAALYARSQAFVKEFYATPSMLPVHEHGLEAILFHGSTRAARNANGRPIVVYVYPEITSRGDDSVQFRRLLELAEKSAISPLVIMPSSAKDFVEFEPLRTFLDSHGIPYFFAPYRSFLFRSQRGGMMSLPEEEASVRSLLTRQKVSLVHTMGCIPVFGKVCRELGIPHVASLSDAGDNAHLPEGSFPFRLCTLVQSESIHGAKKWGTLSEGHWFSAQGVVPEALYETGFDRLYSETPYAGDRIRIGFAGGLISEKYQLEIIRAVSQVIQSGCSVELDIFGERTIPPDVHDHCRDLIGELNLQDHVFFRSVVEDLRGAYSGLDIWVSLCTSGSLPRDTKEAMASGTLVILLQVMGKPELMRDYINGILVRDSEPEHIAQALIRCLRLEVNDALRLRRNAYRMARQEFHPRRGLADLLSMYNLSLQIHAGDTSRLPVFRMETTPGAPQIPQVVLSPASPRSYFRLGRRLTYQVIPQHSQWEGLDVLGATHQHPAENLLRLQVLSEAGQLLRDVSANPSRAPGNDCLAFRFDPITNSSGERFALRFKISEGASHTQINFFETNSPEPWSRFLLRRTGLRTTGNSLCCRMHYRGKD
jgi:O-antigen biosynthesis protein